MCGGDGYLPGLRALGNSLRESGSRERRIAMVTDDVSADARRELERLDWEPRRITPIENPNGPDDLLFARYAGVFNKLNVWRLDDLEKAVFLDADTVVVRNVDDLFQRPAVSAAPDFFRPDRFNSGVMVVEPSRTTYDALVRGLAGSRSYDGGDQGFLNEFFSDWYAWPVEHRLPIGYNVHHFVYQFLCNHPQLKQGFDGELRIVHYTLQKPWQGRMVTGGSRLWWHMYFAGAAAEPAWRARLHALSDWTFGHLMTAVGA
jgi:glycogenin glucosyltransferase